MNFQSFHWAIFRLRGISREGQGSVSSLRPNINDWISQFTCCAKICLNWEERQTSPTNHKWIQHPNTIKSEPLTCNQDISQSLWSLLKTANISPTKTANKHSKTHPYKMAQWFSFNNSKLSWLSWLKSSVIATNIMCEVTHTLWREMDWSDLGAYYIYHTLW